MSSLNKKKIVHFGPLSSGHIQKWTKGLGDKYNISYITYAGHDGAVYGKKYLLPKITGTKIDYILNLPLFLCLLIKIRPELVHAHYFSSYGLLLSLVPFRCKKFLSVWGSDINDLDLSSKYKKILYQWSLSKFVYINSAAKHLTEKIEEIINNANVETYQYGVSHIPEFLSDSKFKIKPDNEAIEFYSPRNFDDLYRIELLINEFSNFLRNNEVNAHLYIYGRGSEEQCLNIKRLCSEKHITYVGFIEHEELLSRIKTHDIVVSIPIKDGTPLSLFEGVAHGCYPILSDIVANRNWFNEPNALYCDEKNISSAFYKAYKLMKDQSKNNIIQDNHDLAFSSCNYEKNILKLDLTYKKHLS